MPSIPHDDETHAVSDEISKNVSSQGIGFLLLKWFSWSIGVLLFIITVLLATFPWSIGLVVVCLPLMYCKKLNERFDGRRCSETLFRFGFAVSYLVNATLVILYVRQNVELSEDTNNQKVTKNETLGSGSNGALPWDQVENMVPDLSIPNFKAHQVETWEAAYVGWSLCMCLLWSGFAVATRLYAQVSSHITC